MTMTGYLIPFAAGVSGGVCSADDLPDGATPVAPDVGLRAAMAPGAYTWDGSSLQPVALTLDEARAQQIAAMDAAYADACAQDVTYTTSGGTTAAFQADPASRAILSDTLAGLAAAGSTPPAFWWLSADNQQIAFTHADLQGLAAAMLAQGWAAFQRRQARKDAIRSAATVADVQSMTW